MYKAALALIAIGVLGICPAWAQAQTGAGAARNGDKASAYYHYSLAHMYADLASNGASGASRDNIREYLNKAIENYKEAIKADPSAPVLTEELAELYVGSGRLREAQSEAEEAIKQNPNDVNAHRMLARVFTSQIGDQQNHVDEAMLRKALEQYQKITELDTKDVDSLVMLGRLQRIVQKSADAEKSYRKALTIDPDNEEALVGLATALDDAGDHNGAADILKKLTEKNPSPEALLRLASSYEQMKEYGLAAETLSRALAANPPNAGELKRAMADYLDQAKKYDEALKVFQDLVKEEPRDAASFLRMSQIYSEMRNFSMAREMSNKAKAIEPDNLDVRLNEVGILEAEGKMPDAVSALKEILSTTVKRNYNPAERLVRGRLLRELAKLNTQMDQTDAAVEAYHQIADLDPDKAPETAALIINTYQVAKEYAKAEQEAEAALKKWPDDRSVRSTHAMAIADMGKVDPAAAEVKKLLDGKNDRETYLILVQ